MKIKNVQLNQKKKALEIVTTKGTKLSLPFVKLPKTPTKSNPILSAFIDSDLARRALTIQYKSGVEESIHLDAFLDYNKNPDLLRELVLHDFTVQAKKHLASSGLSKHEIVRRLRTSPSQLYRLLDPTNTRKSIDEMLKLLAALGCRIEWRVKIDQENEAA